MSGLPTPAERGVLDLLLQARAAFARYRMNQGKRLLAAAEEAIAAGGGDDLSDEGHLRLRVTRSWVLFDEEGLASAEGLLREVRVEALAQGRPAVAASSDAQTALLRARVGDFDGAMSAMLAAEEHRASMPESDQARLMLNRGAIAYHLMELDQAAADLAAAAELSRRLDLAEVGFKALHNQGCAEFVRGDLPAALRLMDQAAALGSGVNRGMTELDRARVLLEAGLVREAASSLGEAVDALAATDQTREVWEAQIDLAHCELALGRHARAAARAAEAEAVFAARGEAYWADHAALVRLSAVVWGAAQTSDDDGAADPGPAARLAQARHTAERLSAGADQVLAARARLLLAHAACDRGEVRDLAEAGVVLDGARGLARSPYLASRLGYAFARARLDTALGRKRPARERLARAAEDLAGAQRRTAGVDARTALAVHAGRLADLDLASAIVEGDPVGVLLRVERWRRALGPATRVRPSPDPDEALLLAKLRHTRESLAHAAGSARADLRTEVARLERVASAARWRTSAIATEHPHLPPTVPRVRRALEVAARRGTAVLALVVLDGQVTAALWPTHGSPSLLKVARVSDLRRHVARLAADCDAAARTAADPHLGPVVAAAAADSAKAVQALLEPVLEPVGQTPLVVLGSELFGSIPWGLLPCRRGAATTLTPSLLMWAEHSSDAPTRSRRAAGWDVGGRGERAPGSGSAYGGGIDVVALAGPGVPHATCELEAINRAWGGRAREAPCASRADLLDALTGADVVHVAAHGEHQAENPLFSCLTMADGPAFAHELEALPLTASLVVLSACDAGRGTARPGEEALGWPSALLSLGVDAVIAPVAAVRDDESAALMGSLHRRLASGTWADAALAHAVADQDGPLTPFVCFGTPWRRPSP